jgi:hypothetical protein
MFKTHKLALVPTNEKVEINGSAFFLSEFLVLTKNPELVGKKCELYVLSDDEIGDNEWVYSIHGTPNVQKTEGESYHDRRSFGWQKIIATTNTSLNLPQIPTNFVQQFIEQYNNGIVLENVEVECVYTAAPNSSVENHNYFPIKINSDNTINIKPTKTSWSRDEVVELINDAVGASHDWSSRNDDIHSLRIIQKQFLNDWIEKNL